MKKINTLSLTLTALAAAFLIQIPAHASFGFSDLLITNTGATAPSTYNIAQTNASVGSSLAAEYKTINSANGVIQTFVAPTTAEGHSELLRFYIRAGDFGSVAAPTSWSVTIGKYSGTTVTSTQNLSLDATIPTANIVRDNYLEFNLGDNNYVQLDDGANYFFQVKSSGGGMTLVRTTGTTAGTGGYGTAASLNGSTLTFAPGSLNYYLETVAVPEPSEWAMIPVLGTVAFLAFRRFRKASVA